MDSRIIGVLFIVLFVTLHVITYLRFQVNQRKVPLGVYINALSTLLLSIVVFFADQLSETAKIPLFIITAIITFVALLVALKKVLHSTRGD